jgi:hypothetical protein
MNAPLILNLFLLLFLVFSLIESRIQFIVSSKNTLRERLSPKILAPFLLIGTLLILLFITLGPKTAVSWYIRISFSVLVFGHALWLSLSSKTVRKFLLLALAVSIISYRLLLPSEISHNLFLFTALLWIGPFFTQLELLTQRRFFIISVIWFLYDISYVWLTPLAKTVVSTTESVGFPLAFVWGENFIGTADFLWAGCLVSVLKNQRVKWFAVMVLIGSHVLLQVVANTLVKITLFPLLVVWVPLGFLLFYIDRRAESLSQDS